VFTHIPRHIGAFVLESSSENNLTTKHPKDHISATVEQGDSYLAGDKTSPTFNAQGPRMDHSIVLGADLSCAGGVARRSHTGSMRPPRALPSRRLDTESSIE
jgi:hypothetical protein